MRDEDDAAVEVIERLVRVGVRARVKGGGEGEGTRGGDEARARIKVGGEG